MPTNGRSAGLLFALLCLAPLRAARAADPEVKFDQYQLSNGLTVILSEDHRLPQVAVDVWYHLGAADQAPGQSGFAHLFEHLMSSGSKHVQPSPLAVLESIGATGIGGSAGFDWTNYFETVASSQLATALWVESDRMAFLLDTLDERTLELQRELVAGERRRRYQGQPYGQTDLRRCDLLYPSPHPYFQCAIGSQPQTQAATVDDLKAFFRANYGPQNASIALVGDFDPAAARALIEKHFGPVPRGPEVKRASLPPPSITGVVKQTLQDPVAAVPRLGLAWAGVKPYSDDAAAGEVLAAILGGGRSSRLYRTLVVDREAASAVTAVLQPLALGGWFVIDVDAKAGRGAAELLPLVQAELEAVKRDGPAPVEVERAVRRILAGKVREVERIGSRANLLNSYQTELGDPGFLPRDLARYRAVTPEAVKAFANRYLLEGQRLELLTAAATGRTAGTP